MLTFPPDFGHRYVRARRLLQPLFAAFWLALPLTGALQLDVAHVRLLVFGHPWPAISADLLPLAALQRGAAPRWEVIAPLLLAAVGPVVLLAAAFVLVARTFGRLHCGFVCTYGFLAGLGESLFRWARRPGPGRAARLLLAWALVGASAPVVAFAILSFFVGPSALAAGLLARDPALVAPFLVLVAVATAAGGFVRFRFCRYVCGVGFVQTLAWMSNRKALEVGFHAAPAPDGSHGGMRDCTGCHGCRDVCPVGFDPRQPKRFMLACIQCGLCVERCEDELSPLGKGAALGFHLHDPMYPLLKQDVRPQPSASIRLVDLARAVQPGEPPEGRA